MSEIQPKYIYKYIGNVFTNNIGNKSEKDTPIFHFYLLQGTCYNTNCTDPFNGYDPL